MLATSFNCDSSQLISYFNSFDLRNCQLNAELIKLAKEELNNYHSPSYNVLRLNSFFNFHMEKGGSQRKLSTF